jgi:hypothetical protein
MRVATVVVLGIASCLHAGLFAFLLVVDRHGFTAAVHSPNHAKFERSRAR